MEVEIEVIWEKGKCDGRETRGRVGSWPTFSTSSIISKEEEKHSSNKNFYGNWILFYIFIFIFISFVMKSF